MQALLIWFAVTLLVHFAYQLRQRYLLGWCTSTARMDGKTVIVTGANTGIGKETALDLARRGACVILGCRDLEKKGVAARDEIIARSGNKDVHVLPLDLASLDSVRNFVELVKQHTDKLHVLVNNAGGGGYSNVKTEDGLLEGMQVNHFGPFLLTLLLIDLLKKTAPSRIVFVSSMLHRFAFLQMDNLNCEKRWLGHMLVYNNSKLANVLISNQFAKKLRSTGVTSNSLNPGPVRTEIFRRTPILFSVINFLLYFSFKNAVEGAQTTIHLAVAEELENVSGKYFDECRELAPSSAAKDEKLASALWEESLRLIKLKPEEMELMNI